MVERSDEKYVQSKIQRMQVFCIPIVMVKMFISFQNTHAHTHTRARAPIG